MEISIFKLIKNLMDAQGIDTHYLTPPYENIEKFDGGIRKQIFVNMDYCDMIRHFENNCTYNSIYMVRDQFAVHYILFKIPKDNEESEKSEYIIIGPYILGDDKPVTTKVIEENGLLLSQIPELQEYYDGTPVVAAKDILESMIFALIQTFFSDINYKLDRTDVNLFKSQDMAEFRVDNERKFSMAMIEERYQYEDEMLEAIEQGDYTKAILANNPLKKYRVQPRAEESLRDNKNMLIVLNSLYRKAVQNAKVHPAHIDSVSTSFAKRIERSGSTNELGKIGDEMTRKYCLLVQNYSLRGYSQIVQNAINYIDFNLTEPLTLKYIAEKVLVNSSYLSALFKKETGKNITDYINQKRVQSSLSLLATTNLPIQTIAEKVGIYDENYFSRLFKKVQNMTAREYRNIMKAKK